MEYTKNSQNVRNWQRNLTRHLTKKDIMGSKKYMRRCLTSLVIREILIKTTVDSTSQPVEWQKKKMLTIPSAGEDEKQLELS